MRQILKEKIDRRIRVSYIAAADSDAAQSGALPDDQATAIEPPTC
jgi:hypothetical protein